MIAEAVEVDRIDPQETMQDRGGVRKNKLIDRNIVTFVKYLA